MLITSKFRSGHTFISVRVARCRKKHHPVLFIYFSVPCHLGLRANKSTVQDKVERMHFIYGHPCTQCYGAPVRRSCMACKIETDAGTKERKAVMTGCCVLSWYTAYKKKKSCAWALSVERRLIVMLSRLLRSEDEHAVQTSCYKLTR